MSRIVAICLAMVAGYSLICNCAFADPIQEDTWVVYQGKRLFKLCEAKQIPVSQIARLEGPMTSDRPPQISVLSPESGKPEELEVTVAPDGKRWSAPLPKFEPKAKTEISITSFVRLSREQEARLEQLIIRFLMTTAEGWKSGTFEYVPPGELPDEIASYVRRSVPDDTAFDSFKYVSDNPVDLVEALAANFSSKEDNNLTRANSLNIREKAVRQLLDFLYQEYTMTAFRCNDSADSLTEGLRQALSSSDVTLVEQFRTQLLPGLDISVAQSDDFAGFDGAVVNELLYAVLGKNPGLFPLPSDQLGALRKVIDYAETGYCKRVKGDSVHYEPLLSNGLAVTLREALVVLSRPLLNDFPVLKAKVAAIQRRTFVVTPSSMPLLFADLARYGTIDASEALVPGRDEFRTFFTFSFFPTGPESRTPTKDDVQWSPTIGYSVSGNEGDQEMIYFGVTLRFNRTVNLSFGASSRVEDTKVWYGTLGVTGDLTVLPFLKGLLVTE